MACNVRGESADKERASESQCDCEWVCGVLLSGQQQLLQHAGIHTVRIFYTDYLTYTHNTYIR